ncbi:MAG: hypothetical protein ABL909_04395 [Sphingopyxis sp.]
MAHAHKLSLLAGTALGLLLVAQGASAQIVNDDYGVPANAPSLDGRGNAASGPRDDNGRRNDDDDNGRRNGDDDGNARPHARVDVSPYIEVGQVLTAELGNGGDVLTYSSVAVGVDASVATRRAQLAANVRYERRIAWGDNLRDNDVISGLARGRYDLTQGLALEAGALASRASIDGRGGASNFGVGDRSNSANIYSIYAGPTFGRRFGDIDVGAAYRFGYSRSEIEFQPSLTGATRPIGSFDESTNHAAIASIGMSPGRLPFGWRVSGGWDRDDAGQLDQRYDGKFGRLDVTLPVSSSLALVGGVGYEDIEVSYRPPLTDVAGAPVVDANGRLVGDTAQPRTIAFETSGLIYDAGVQWRPSRRVALEARVGRRYGDTVYTGSATWQASRNTAYQLGIYDNLSTLGRSLSAGLAALPTDFEVVRNGIDGSLSGCAFGASGGTCLTPALNNATGFAFRNRGATLSMSSRLSDWSVGAAMGYDRRTYVANGLTAIPGLDGTVDETWFAFLSASRALSRDTSFGLSAYATYFDGGLGFDATSAGASASLSHMFMPRLQGNAAVSYNAINQDGFNSRAFASALLGMRYSF